jgi:hypothetical protein
MGYPLTAPHGFARLKEERDQLGEMIELTFLPNNWSLKAVLTGIASSKLIARRAPVISQRDNAYKLPPILNPWTVADPTQVTNPTPDQTNNGQGEMVHPYRVSTLLRQIAAALGWKQPAPAMFPEAGYPSALALNLGQAVSPQHPGFSGFYFQSLLALEAEVATCDKTNRLPAGVTDDWIDALVSAIGTFNAANPGAPITLGEAWKVVKDRLIQDPTISTVLPASLANVAGAKTEQQALVDFFRKVYGDPTLTLNSTAAAGSPADIAKLQSAMRRSCGVLVKDPFFLLANITPKYSDNNIPDATRLSICLPNEPCSYAAVCSRWTPTLFGMGYNIACLDHSVVELPMVSYPNDPTGAIGRVAAGAPPSGQDWAVLTRRSTESPARLRLSPAAPPAPAATPLPPPAEYDLLQTVQIRSRTALRGLARVAQRMSTMCPGGICGGVARAAPNIAHCLENAADNNCLALSPVCDPRTQNGENSCGALPADLTASHVLVLWAEGADVEDAANARLLRAGDLRWQPLQARTKLAAGDKIYVPLTGSIVLP